jgi:hypothetical protein
MTSSDRSLPTMVTAVLGPRPLVYEVRAGAPGLDFLRSRHRLEVFGYEVRKLLADVRQEHGQERTVHLFAAAPAPAAVQFGRSIRGYDPPFLAYEYRKADRTYVPVLTIDPRPE